MAYTRKTWVNVPDPNNPPSIPQGQDALARYDAANMNRIEDGIEEAIAPIYTEAATFETLTSGEKISIAFGKIKKAISDFVSHSNDNTKHITSTERTTWNENITSITNIQAEIENAAKIATGFYIGSDTAGVDNKSKLQFAFVPKYVIVQGSYARGEVMCVAYAQFIYGINNTFYHEHRQDNVVEQSHLAVSWNDEDKSLSWNITDSTHSAEQLNASGIQYSYVAIG